MQSMKLCDIKMKQIQSKYIKMKQSKHVHKLILELKPLGPLPGLMPKRIYEGNSKFELQELKYSLV